MSGARTPAMPNGRMMSPFLQASMPHPPPPQFANGDGQLMGIPPHPSAMAYHGQPSLYFQPPPPPQYSAPEIRRLEHAVEIGSVESTSLAPAANINGMDLPASHSDIYLDQYGRPHSSFQSPYIASGDMQPPPAKRQKSEDGQMLEINGDREETLAGEAEEDDDSIDEIRDAPPLPNSMRLSTKPLRPKPTANSSRTRSKLLSLFSMDEPVDIRAVFGLPTDAPTEFDVDTIIDNQGHTALHWACALAKSSIITQLIDLGADIYRGNYAGETPLIRSVLTTNEAEAGTFAELLEHLSPSVRTLDHAYRTVIHHIALIAGVKGRAASARAYMAGVLEWVAKEQRVAGSAPGQEVNGGAAPSLSLKNLVDVQDVHGDTALNVAARVGNKGLLKLLLDAGADKARANKLGLKPQDFGIEIEVNNEMTYQNLLTEFGRHCGYHLAKLSCRI